MDTIERPQAKDVSLLQELPLRLHHNAYVVKDHEANRRFLEDLLGIPLVATWCEKTYRADLGREVEFCHTFFGLKDGGALAFFQFADEEMYQLTQAKQPPQIGSHYHIALKVSDETYDELKARLVVLEVLCMGTLGIVFAMTGPDDPKHQKAITTLDGLKSAVGQRLAETGEPALIAAGQHYSDLLLSELSDGLGLLRPNKKGT